MKTVEYAKVVYKKVEEFAEKVRVVLNEEFNKFVNLLWEDGSWAASDKESEFKHCFVLSTFVLTTVVCHSLQDTLLL